MNTVMFNGALYVVDFDEALHQYYLIEGEARRAIPGVSHILEATGNHGSFKPPARYYEKGKRIHELCEAEDRGTLGELADEDLHLSTYVQAWQAFKHENRVRVLGIEEIVFEPDLFYCGTLDRTIIIAGRDNPVVVDIKSGQKADWHVLQLAAYLRARTGNKWREYDMANVYLKPNGRYGWFPAAPGQRDWAMGRWVQIATEYKEAA